MSELEIVPIPPPPPFLARLTKQQRALVDLLDKYYPNYLSKFDIMEHLPCMDHVQERTWRQAAVVVANVRKKLGKDTVENLWGVGYRISPELHAKLREL